MHLFWSTVTMPFSALLLMAETGHAVLHGASPQCMHAIEMFMAVTAGNVPDSIFTTSRQRGPISTSFHVLHAISQAWHFTQRS
jgi:hypothetical protein